MRGCFGHRRGSAMPTAPGRGRAGTPRRSAGSSRTAPRSPCSRRCGRCRSRTAACILNFCRKRHGCGALGNRRIRRRRPRPGTGGVARRGLDQRALFERVVHERAHAAEHRPEDRQANRRIALRGRHEHRLVRHRARAVPRVVVAIAEEDEEVELGAPRCSTCSISAGLAGPSLSSQRELVGDRVRLARTPARDRRPKSCGLRACAHRESGARVTPLTCSSPGGSSFFHVM